MESEAIGIREHLDRHHDGKFGYVVYRCVYEDDEKWANFMERLTAYTNTGFRENEDGEMIKPYFAWDVRDDEEELQGASKAKVRRLFNKWVDSIGGNRTVTKYTSCIYVDEEVMDAVLEGEDPNSEEHDDIMNPRAFVKLLDDQFTEEAEPVTIEEMPDEKMRERYYKRDEGFPPIEESTFRLPRPNPGLF